MSRHRHSENGHRYSHDHSGFQSAGELEAHLFVRPHGINGYPAGRFTSVKKPCEAPGCDRGRKSNAPWSKSVYCAKHADRVRIHGDPTHERWPSTWDRFVDRVQIAANDCWLWMGGASGRPGALYGQFWAGNRRILAHRFAYQTMVGAIPEGLELDHLCRTTKCVNPDHLEAVTAAVNMQRAYAAKKGATS